jgi:hypothetical protein
MCEAFIHARPCAVQCPPPTPHLTRSPSALHRYALLHLLINSARCARFRGGSRSRLYASLSHTRGLHGPGGKGGGRAIWRSARRGLPRARGRRASCPLCGRRTRKSAHARGKDEAPASPRSYLAGERGRPVPPRAGGEERRRGGRRPYSSSPPLPLAAATRIAARERERRRRAAIALGRRVQRNQKNTKRWKRDQDGKLLF